MDAVNTPVRRSRRETSNADFDITQPSDILMPATGELERGEVIINSTGRSVNESYMQDLAMAEDPVTILIYPSREKNAPVVVDCWVNGRGAEVFVNGKWSVFNCLPVNVAVTTKRKYVEVLARARIDTVATEVEDETADQPSNRLIRNSSSSVVFTVIGDKNPRGGEWLRRIMAERS